MQGQTIRLAGPAQRSLAKQIIDAAPENAIVNIKGPKRTLEQNAKMWAMLSDISRAKPEGRTHTPEMWKALAMHACGFEVQFLVGLDGQPFPTGFRSSNMTKAQMSDLIEWLLQYGAEQGVQWSDDHDEQNTDAPPPASDQEAAEPSPDASTEGGEVPPPASPPSPLIQYAGYLVRMVQNFVDDGSITETDECKKALNEAWENATDPDGIAYLVDASEETMKKAKSFTGWAMDVIDQKTSMLKFRSKVCEVANCRPEDLEQPA